MGVSTRSFDTFLLEHHATGTFDLLKKLPKINRVYTTEKYSKLTEHASRKGKFAINTSNDFNREYKQRRSKLYKQNGMSLQSYGRAVSRAQEANFSISQYCIYGSKRPREEMAPDLADDFTVTSNKTADLPKETAFR
jgi:hypothetical protein